MTLILLGFGGLAVIAGLFIIIYGIVRVRNDMHGVPSISRGRTSRDQSLKAIHTGDPELLAKAPQPKTLYDLFFNRVSQDFVITQYDKLWGRWSDYRCRISDNGSAAAMGNLTNDFAKSSIYADIAEEELRKARAIREQEKLWETEPHQNEPEPDTVEAIYKKIDKLSQQRTETEDNITLHPEIKEKKLNVIENEINRLFRKLEKMLGDQ